MFIYDKPIETEKDDFLNRTNFSKHLGKALLDWKEQESLIIAIYGEWGSGKSSIINLAIEFIRNSPYQNKPTIIEFNPWNFSEEGKLGEHFFNEIAKELVIKNDTGKDKKIAKKLKYYASILNLVPDEHTIFNPKYKILLFLILLFPYLDRIIANFVTNKWIHDYVFPIFGIILIVLFFGKDFLQRFANYFEKKAEYCSKTVSEIKKEIKKELIERDKKLVIVIDDIDRLNQSEIRQIFRLLRINADFPNTIYLLAFDRRIVEKSLEEQVGVSGKDYLNKIVQVNFTAPFVNPFNVHRFLFRELDRVLDTLPVSAKKYFESNDPHWPNVYHSGFKNLFKNIRDVKRYVSSLEFNISQMYQGGVMEVNVVDFFAIEAIRVFVPDFYLFMRNNKTLFTSTDSNNKSPKDSYPGKEELKEVLNKISEEMKKPIYELIKRLFPQLDGILETGNSRYGHGWQSTWSADLKVCATNNFDSYFTLIPGGDEEELSQFEIEKILNATHSAEGFETILREYIEKNKLRKVLQRMQDFTREQTHISQGNVKNIILALFNISDDLPEEEVGMWGSEIEMDSARIIYQLLIREPDKNKNFEILKEAIFDSKALFGPIYEVSLQSSKEDKGNNSDDLILTKEKLGILQKLCVKKINSTSINDLLEHKELPSILYIWKEWDKKGKKWISFIEEILKDDQNLISFISKFVSKSKKQIMGDYGYRTEKKFKYKELNSFINLKQIKQRLEKVKATKTNLYVNNKAVLDLFLGNFDDKDKDKGELR